MRQLSQAFATNGALLRGPLMVARIFKKQLTASRPDTVTRSDPVGSTHGMSTAELRRHLTITVISGHPDRKALAQYLKPSIRDWQAQDWEGLGHRLARLDRTHATLPSGERVATALGQALFRHIVGATTCQTIDRGQAVPASDLSEDLFSPLVRAMGHASTEPAIFFLAAQFNLELGWARRGDDYSEFASDEMLFSAQARFDVARNILDQIASRAPHSAYYAELDYRVRAAEGTTEEDLTRAATRWSRTDPNALTPYSVHGQHLLPRWYGTESSLSAYASRIWSKTHETLGASGYAACFLSAIAVDPEAILKIDMAAFQQGLIDMMQDSDDPDVTCNAVLRTLWEIGTDGFATDGRDSAALRRARAALRRQFTYLAHHALGPVMPEVWGPGWTEARILHAIAEAFEPEITAGRYIAIGLDGAVITDRL